MTQKGSLFKGQQKKKSIPPNRHGKVSHTRKGKRVVKPSKVTKEMDADKELSKFINYCNEVKAATVANKDGGQNVPLEDDPLWLLLWLPVVSVDMENWRKVKKNDDEISPCLLRCGCLSIRPQAAEVAWASLLQGPFMIPRNLFMLWLAILERISMLDKSWMHISDSSCVLCTDQTLVAHSHLFFQCTFSRRWFAIRYKEVKFASLCGHMLSGIGVLSGS
ncbi:UNVERIFIED_CONTAM: hypothetical protein Scaly_0835300 [Sesamum calycinum]|uniref:Reverse transcriptase zinc-binding domain-containing protein n=1 Tax=Sesamum calycinum TaxID=2727403 RepID=A0AAW2RAI6_9LAMI